MKKTLFCTLVLATMATIAKADSLTITLDQPVQAAAPGATVDFTGTITNDTNSTIFLNGDSITLDGLSFAINDDFFSTVPFSLTSGASSGDIDLFDVTVSDPLADAAGVYSGSYVLQGGADGGAQDVLGSVDFSVDTAASSPVPEPSSIVLLLSGGLAALGPVVRRMRRGDM